MQLHVHVQYEYSRSTRTDDVSCLTLVSAKRNSEMYSSALMFCSGKTGQDQFRPPSFSLSFHIAIVSSLRSTWMSITVQALPSLPLHASCFMLHAVTSDTERCLGFCIQPSSQPTNQVLWLVTHPPFCPAFPSLLPGSCSGGCHRSREQASVAVSRTLLSSCKMQIGYASSLPAMHCPLSLSPLLSTSSDHWPPTAIATVPANDFYTHSFTSVFHILAAESNINRSSHLPSSFTYGISRLYRQY